MEASSFVACPLPQAVQNFYLSSVPLLSEPDQTEAEYPSDVELLDDRQRDAAIVPGTLLVNTSEPFQTVQPAINAPFWKVFGSTFITIFLAELGDKTQVATLLMSAESHEPWVVFTGAAMALLTTSLLGVLVGQWLSSRVSPKTLDTAAGIMLAVIAVWLLVDVVTM